MRQGQSARGGQASGGCENLEALASRVRQSLLISGRCPVRRNAVGDQTSREEPRKCCVRRRRKRRLGAWPFLWRGLEAHERSPELALACSGALVREDLGAQPARQRARRERLTHVGASVPGLILCRAQ